MAKDAVAKAWTIKPSSDGKRYSAYQAGDFVGPFSTTFPATESAISQGGIWTNGLTTGVDWNDVKTVANTGAFPSAFETSNPWDSIAHLKTSYRAFNARQWVEGTVYKNGSPAQSEIELLLRFDITANNARGYELYWSTNTGLNIFRWNGAYLDFTGLFTSNIQPNDGDVLRFEADGSTLTGYVNGVPKVSGSDSTWATGQPGMGFTCSSGGVLTDYGWKSFRAGNL